MFSFIRIQVIALIVLFVVGCGGGSTSSPILDISVDENGYTTLSSDNVDSVILNLDYENLTNDEINSLVFMREEEKLARDVYLFLYEKWGTKIFNNIAQSEDTHTNAVKALLDKYSIEDPMSDDINGVFKNNTLQILYDSLTQSGSLSLDDALRVGAEIEEIDIVDIENALNTIIDNEDIRLIYGSLMKGSRNHLRAFVDQLDTYIPKYLTQIEFDEIINSSIER